MDDMGGGGGGGSIIGLIITLLISLVLMVGFCAIYGFCIKKICEKTGKDGGMLVWIPILQIFPLFDVVGWEKWKILLFFIPLANIYFMIMFYIELCKARGKSPWMTIMALLPCTAWAFIPYLAFSE
jgi:hypothetical protein